MQVQPIFLPTVAVVAVIGAHVMRVRVPWWRAGLAAWLGLATAGISITAASDGRHPPLVLVVAVGIVAMAGWFVLLELVSGARGGPGRHELQYPAAAIRAKVWRFRRKLQIAVIGFRTGLAGILHRRSRGPRGSVTGLALKQALQQAGGVYIKLGQFLSTRPDLVSPEVANELRELQQRVDPAPRDVVDAVIDEELGENLRSRFTHLEIEPTAAASIAQVYRAVLDDGRPVAVKVQRPEVATQVRGDLRILVRLAERLERRTDWAFELKLAATMRSFAENVEGELDFEGEARNLRAMAAAVADHPRFVVPQPVDGLVRGRVLVMDWVDGTPLADAGAHLDGEERADVARALLRCTLDQILNGGVFHADPHPGNVYLCRDGRIALIDCGAVGVLDRRQRASLQGVLLAVAAQDSGRLRQALRNITIPSRPIDEAQLDRALSALLLHHLGANAEPGGAFLVALMGLMRDFGLAVDPTIGGALRSLSTLQATLDSLSSDFNLLEEAKAYGKSAVGRFARSGLGRSARDEFEVALPAAMTTLVTLPGRVDQLLRSLERGEASVGVHLQANRESQLIGQLVSQLVLVMAPAAIGIIGALLVIAANQRVDTATGRMLQGGGIACIAVAVLVLASTIGIAIRRERWRA